MWVQLVGGCGWTRDTSGVIFEYRVELNTESNLQKKQKRKICSRWDFVLNFEVAKTSKEIFKNVQSKSQKSAVEFLTFKNGCLKAENGDAGLYTLLVMLSMISIILLVIVWYMLWLTCSRIILFLG